MSVRSYFGRVPLQERINFARHLAVMVKAGLSLLTGLQIIKKQTRSKTLKHIVDQLILDVNRGRFLSDGLGLYRQVFGDLFINVVRVGETSGTLADNLLYLSDEMKKSAALRSKVRAALTYPVILLMATIFIAVFLTVYIFPKLITAFTSVSVQLPWITRALIATLSFLKTYGWLMTLGLLAAAIALRSIMIIPAVRYLFNRLLLTLPVVGQLIKDVNAATATRLLGTLLKGGLQIVESLKIVGNAMHNIVYQRLLLEAAEEARKGRSLSQFFTAHHRLFPPMVAAMVAVGESTGSLEDNLFYLAEYYTEEIDTSLKNLTTLLEPLIVLIMGLVVGFVALAVITPIYSLTQGFR